MPIDASDILFMNIDIKIPMFLCLKCKYRQSVMHRNLARLPTTNIALGCHGFSLLITLRLFLKCMQRRNMG